MSIDGHWIEQAECRKHDPQLWDVEADSDEQEFAALICWNACPVQDACDAFAQRVGINGGTWAGVYHPERRTAPKEEASA